VTCPTPARYTHAGYSGTKVGPVPVDAIQYCKTWPFERNLLCGGQAGPNARDSTTLGCCHGGKRQSPEGVEPARKTPGMAPSVPAERRDAKWPSIGCPSWASTYGFQYHAAHRVQWIERWPCCAELPYGAAAVANDAVHGPLLVWAYNDTYTHTKIYLLL
jgi:hypothetical protein